MKLYISLTVLALATVFCRAEDAGPVIKLTDLKLFPNTERGYFDKPLEGLEFLSSQQRQLAILYFDKAAAGQTVTARVIAARTTLGAEKEVIQFKPASIDEQGRLPFELKFPAAVPPGLYRVEVTKDDKLIGSAGYIVRAVEVKKTPITVAKIDLLRGKADGGAEPAPIPTAADHHLYFVAKTKGARTGGAHVVWTFTAVDTTAGKNQELPSADEKNWPLDDTTLIYDMALPRDWPLGTYHVALKIDEEVVKDLDFEIKQ